MEQNERGVISEDLIFLDQEVTSQDEVLQIIVNNAQTNGYVTDKDKLYEAVKKREQEVPTAIGYSIAIPHGKTDAVSYPFISFLRTTEEIKWTEENEERVRLIFLIGVPNESENNLHLKFISQLSKKLLDQEFRTKLMAQTSSNGAFKQLNSIEI
ncbi:MAG: fructose PTS transporter subunit IIA [Tetragenococcus koreensis]|uniref:PTS EIIA type-2 domain-containing protein n=2 Tax=Tetragenococcus halophilus TaxID=51669 RepID=A0A2H6CVW5_TETHA|nr:fructose PTS transporter subunit IIA [Tetragenococcus halophilus]MDN6140343.1 fructose PTS transporter subunit IIA [Tetragenococcus koreensis]MDN6182032.1 fructose PTS transporter subunit IIA [Staphylococcus equorum]MDN6195335.1 fructose PTS transporter subunit IIA [Atopostipes suicloacalis]MDN6391676.1 fructose PTS transporter subunit IIA [Lactococcus lactis]MDN6640759.1 fructose PTS transporter subunit IIA [Tetragenococcus sp.]